jgi:DNA (cytosine-5)-methyltransferase 1
MDAARRAVGRAVSRPIVVGSLFSGVGGMDLGLELAGFRTAWQCEIDPWRRLVLARHWPNIPRFADVTTLAADPSALPPVDVICGGFPCQDASVAGRGAGIHGARTGLWFRMLDIIQATRPIGVIGENVPGLLRRGLDVACRGLQDAGYEVEATRLSAADIGFSHRRERVVIVAVLANADGPRQLQRGGSVAELRGWAGDGGAGPQAVGHGAGHGLLKAAHERARAPDQDGGQSRPDAHIGPRRGEAQPGVDRAPDGLPPWVDRRCAGRGEDPYPEEPPRTATRRRGDGQAQRVTALGNAFVPLCAYVAGMRLMERLRGAP